MLQETLVLQVMMVRLASLANKVTWVHKDQRVCKVYKDPKGNRERKETKEPREMLAPRVTLVHKERPVLTALALKEMPANVAKTVHRALQGRREDPAPPDLKETPVLRAAKEKEAHRDPKAELELWETEVKLARKEIPDLRETLARRVARDKRVNKDLWERRVAEADRVLREIPVKYPTLSNPRAASTLKIPRFKSGLSSYLTS